LRDKIAPKMTQDPRIKLPNTKSPNKNTNSPSYSPSVPISVYRQVTGELEATQQRMESLQVQNQRLTQENRQLRQELQGFLELAQHLQQVVITLDRSPTFTPKKQPNKPIAVNNAIENNPLPSDNPLNQVEEIPVSPSLHYEIEEKVKGMNGWVLAIAITLILLTAFGMAFLIIRPILNQNQR
jgi:hypothetical protein